MTLTDHDLCRIERCAHAATGASCAETLALVAEVRQLRADLAAVLNPLPKSALAIDQADEE